MFHFNLMLLGAAQAAKNSAQTADAQDALTPLYLLVGTAVVGQLIGLGFGLVKWLGSRTVEREDKDKEKLEARIESHEKKFHELEDSVADVEKTILTMQSELKQVLHALESIRGGVSEVKLNLDSRFEKQADFYRSAQKEFTVEIEKKLDEVEFRLRQDMSRAMADSIHVAKRKPRG